MFFDPEQNYLKKSREIFAEINIDFHYSQSSLEFHFDFNIHSHFNFQFEMLKCLMKGKWIFRVFHSFYPSPSHEDISKNFPLFLQLFLLV